MRPTKPPKISDRSPSAQRGRQLAIEDRAPSPEMLALEDRRAPSAPPGMLALKDRSRSPLASERAKQLMALVGEQARRKQDKLKNEMSSAVQRISAKREAEDAAASLILVKQNPQQKALDAFLDKFSGMGRSRSDSPGGRPPKDALKIPENMSTLRPKMAKLPSQALAIRSAPYVRA